MTDSVSVEMMALAEQVVRKTAGRKSEIASVEDWGSGALNTCYRIETKNPSQSFFLKVENENIVPSTRRGQIAREVHSLSLVRAAGIVCPVVVAYDDSAAEFGHRYMLQEFIDAELLWCIKDQLTQEQNEGLQKDILGVIARMKSITRPYFGDVYEKGVIGQHPTWREAYRSMSRLLLKDGRELGLFQAEDARFVEEMLGQYSSQLVSPGPASLIHGDLGKHNVLADMDGKNVKLRAVIDFGNAMFGPAYMNEDGIRLHGGWGLEPMDACREYGISRFEYAATHLVFSLEMAVFMGQLSRWKQEDPGVHGLRFVEECRQLAG